MNPIRYHVNAAVTNDEMNALFAASWEHHQHTDFIALLRHSLVYVCAYEDKRLIGFVKVIGDGGVHGFLLDTTVHPDYRRRGIGQELVRRAADATREFGVEWLHVDYEPHLETFYTSCGFEHTLAGLMPLQ